MKSQDYWQKQDTEPLFPDLMWSRPETTTTAGKLLVVGGNLHGFSAPALAYNTAADDGIGVVRVLMPDSLRKFTKMLAEHARVLPSTPSGSFAKIGLSELLAESEWADAVLLAGDIGKNSETAILFESFNQKYPGLLVVTNDSIDMFYAHSEGVLRRKNTLLIATMAQLQKLLVRAGCMVPIYSGMNLAQLVDAMHLISLEYQAAFVTTHQEHFVIGASGRVCTTPSSENLTMSQTVTAAKSAVWWLQNPTKQFEAICSALIQKH